MEEFVRPPGLDGTDGRPPKLLFAPDVAVAIAVGKTKEGSELPAKLNVSTKNLPHLGITSTIVTYVSIHSIRTGQSHWIVTWRPRYDPGVGRGCPPAVVHGASQIMRP